MSGAELSVAYRPVVGRSTPGPCDAPLRRALALLFAFYGSTIVALYGIGIQPVVPWPLLLVFVLIVIPFALGAAGGGHPRRGTRSARKRDDPGTLHALGRAVHGRLLARLAAVPTGPLGIAPDRRAMVGLIVFAMYPAVGPCIAFPDCGPRANLCEWLRVFRRGSESSRRAGGGPASHVARQSGPLLGVLAHQRDRRVEHHRPRLPLPGRPVRGTCARDFGHSARLASKPSPIRSQGREEATSGSGRE